MIGIGSLVVGCGMTIAANISGSGISVRMAQATLNTGMGAGEREIGGAVVKPRRGTTVRMAIVTGIAVVRIAAYTLMFIVHCRLTMTLEATENRIITRIGMTVAAGVPLTFMFT